MAGKICPTCKQEITKKFASSCEFCGSSFLGKITSNDPTPTYRPTPPENKTITEPQRAQQSPPKQVATDPQIERSAPVQSNELTFAQKRFAVCYYFVTPELGWLAKLGIFAGIVSFILAYIIFRTKGVTVRFGEFFGFGIVCFVGVIYAYSNLPVRTPARVLDRIIADDLAVAKERSLQKASIDTSELVGESILITGPRFWNTGGAICLYRKGEDNILRFNPINLTVLHLAQHQLIAYQCCVDLVTGNLLNESTEEFFYKDIVSVTTKAESQTYDTNSFGRIQLNEAETFILTTSGGTSIKATLRDPTLTQLMGGGEVPSTNADRATQAIRKMLREKKQN